MLARNPYYGPRKLVLAFDVGTTYSGISYSILQPGQIPDIRGVTKLVLHRFSYRVVLTFFQVSWSDRRPWQCQSTLHFVL